MLERGYIVNREFEKYKDNAFFKALAHSLPGDAEAKILKFQVEAPNVLKKFFDKLGLADLLKEED